MLTVRPISIPADGLAASRGGGLERTMDRLATGLRIRQASDDAAGLGVAADLRTDTRSLVKARNNIGDGMSAVHAAEGGLDVIVDNLQRMRELAVASASDTLDDEERAYLQEEFAQLSDEIDRTAVTTTYGGESLLARPAVDILLLADVSNSMAAELPVFAAELPLLRDRLEAEGIVVRMGVAQASAGAAPAGDPLDGNTTLAELSADPTDTDAALASLGVTGVGLMDPYTAMLDQAGLTDTPGVDGPETHDFGGPAVQKILIYASDTGRETALTPVTESGTASALASGGFRVYATTLVATHAAVFDEITAATGGLTENLDPAGANVSGLMATIGDDIIAQAGRTSEFEVQAGIHDTEHDLIGIGVPTDASIAGIGLDTVSISTSAEARAALDALDDALAVVGSRQAKLGAAWNRLDEALRHNEATTVALSGADSRIRDADMADLTSQLVAQQIVQQAALAARAQANQLHASMIPTLLG